jgi:DNA-binding transcriptional MerR regulator
MNPDYSLTDLARMADVTPRTVRYYVAQGLLPSPEAAGPATRYSEGHLARLRLIRRLQRDHLPLAEIRERLEQMTDAEVAAALAASISPTFNRSVLDAADTVGYIRDLMEQADIEPTIHPAAVPPAAAPVPPERSEQPRPSLALRRSEPPAPSMAMRVSAMPVPEGSRLERRDTSAAADVTQPAEDRPSTRPSHSTWERVVISPDIEIHVRRPLKPLDNKRADTLERYARELFQDEP